MEANINVILLCKVTPFDVDLVVPITMDGFVEVEDSINTLLINPLPSFESSSSEFSKNIFTPLQSSVVQ